MKWKLSKFRAGDTVEVRSREEILATLDADGCFEGMPFMPEMLAFCGQRHRVAAVAHKTCETAKQTWQGRKLPATVHLEGLRCDGSAHGGCQAECNLYWKDAWLKPANHAVRSAPAKSGGGCTAERLYQCTLLDQAAPGEPSAYACQATKVYEATAPLARWNVWQYVRDVWTGNHSLLYAIGVVWLAILEKHHVRTPFGYRLVLRHLHWVHRRVTGRPRVEIVPAIAAGERTPSATLDLRPGEYVRVKAAADIVKTLGPHNRNRGLSFDLEMAAYCGRVLRVKKIVTEILDEQTGQMMRMKHPCIMLEGAYCGGEHSQCRLLCPRAIPPYWREIWLERVEIPALVQSESEDAVCASAGK
jgi:hypothetical protein